MAGAMGGRRSGVGRATWHPRRRGAVMERRIVLFGGSGFVGRQLAPRLAAEGWTVRVASRHPRPEAASAAAGVVAVTADLGAEDQVRRAVTGAEVVINLVG